MNWNLGSILKSLRHSFDPAKLRSAEQPPAEATISIEWLKESVRPVLKLQKSPDYIIQNGKNTQPNIEHPSMMDRHNCGHNWMSLSQYLRDAVANKKGEMREDFGRLHAAIVEISNAIHTSTQEGWIQIPQVAINAVKRNHQLLQEAAAVIKASHYEDFIPPKTKGNLTLINSPTPANIKYQILMQCERAILENLVNNPLNPGLNSHYDARIA